MRSVGSPGLEKYIQLEYIDGRISVSGAIYGEVQFGNFTIGDLNITGHQVFIADIGINNGLWRSAIIDPYGDLSSDPSLWCGWS